jgi:hypothetical protein
MYQSPELPRFDGGAAVPLSHFGPSVPFGPVGPGVPVDGTHAEPLHTSVWPADGAVDDTARPCNWVALPLEALVVE